MPRIALPYRRPLETRTVTHAERDYSVSVGFYPDGTLGEVFADGAKIGSEQQATLADACVLISLLLQHGVSREQIGHSLARVPRWTPQGESEGPASIVGAVVEALI